MSEDIDVFVYDLEELEHHYQVYIRDTFDSEFDEMEPGEESRFSFDGEVDYMENEDGDGIYLEEIDSKLKVYDLEGVIEDQFSGLVSAARFPEETE